MERTEHVQSSKNGWQMGLAVTKAHRIDRSALLVFSPDSLQLCKVELQDQ